MKKGKTKMEAINNCRNSIILANPVYTSGSYCYFYSNADAFCIVNFFILLSVQELLMVRIIMYCFVTIWLNKN